MAVPEMASALWPQRFVYTAPEPVSPFVKRGYPPNRWARGEVGTSAGTSTRHMEAPTAPVSFLPSSSDNGTEVLLVFS